jgi:hypothetical protein
MNKVWWKLSKCSNLTWKKPIIQKKKKLLKCHFRTQTLVAKPHSLVIFGTDLHDWVYTCHKPQMYTWCTFGGCNDSWAFNGWDGCLTSIWRVPKSTHADVGHGCRQVSWNNSREDVTWHGTGYSISDKILLEPQLARCEGCLGVGTNQGRLSHSRWMRGQHAWAIEEVWEPTRTWSEWQQTECPIRTFQSGII